MIILELSIKQEQSLYCTPYLSVLVVEKVPG